jgi:hypothetical protein
VAIIKRVAVGNFSDILVNLTGANSGDILLKESFFFIKILPFMGYPKIIIFSLMSR